MIDEDKIQKQMEFIIDQHAQFSFDIGQIKDIVARLATASLDRIESLENKVSALVDAQIKTEENLSSLAEAQAQADGKVSALVDAQIKTEANLSSLAKAQAHTDERLNDFITVVERYISKGSDGNSQR